MVRARLRQLVAGWLKQGMAEGAHRPAGGWTKVGLAKAAGMTRQAIDPLLDADADIQDDTIQRLSEALGWPIPELVWNDDAPAYDRGKMDGWRLAMREMREWSERMEKGPAANALTGEALEDFARGLPEPAPTTAVPQGPAPAPTDAESATAETRETPQTAAREPKGKPGGRRRKAG
jgi:hypothetical protein